MSADVGGDPSVHDQAHSRKPCEEGDHLGDQALAAVLNAAARQKGDDDQCGARSQREPAHPT